MKTFVNDISEIDYLIRQLTKIASRLRSGQIIDAWRECNGLISYAEKSKAELLKNVAEKVSDA